MLKGLTPAAAALVLFAACADTPTQPAPIDTLNPAALIVPGIPGRAIVSDAIIDVPGSLCQAVYQTPNGQNSAVWNRFGAPADFNITTNDTWIIARCSFLDTTGAYDSNAEVGDIQQCTLTTADGTVYTGGTGTLTSANNVDEDDPTYVFGNGGNTMIRCRFSLNTK